MQLIDKIKTRKSKIGVIGLGYVGLPLVIEFCKQGFSVTGFDVDEKKVLALKQGKSYIKHIPSEAIAAIVRKGSLPGKPSSQSCCHPCMSRQASGTQTRC